MVSVVGIAKVMLMERKIQIEGMRCKSCKSLIEAEVSDIKGVENIEVSLDDREAVILLKQDCIEDIIEAVNGLGFTARVQ
jgi:copper chaperone CopZ